ncbi:MAG TPA: hypothetical protein VNK67_05940 [Burkholderiales bacterium]|nr:hypothetical protein [Burkholderiales bacterium]
MNLGRCPICHSHLSLEAIVQDDCARELLGLLASLPDDLSRSLVSYLGLWRPAKQDLRWDRALRLAREVLALEGDAARLAWALAETVEAIRLKGGQMPIKSHGYLRRVLENAPAPDAPRPAREIRATSRTAEAMRRLIEGA